MRNGSTLCCPHHSKHRLRRRLTPVLGLKERIAVESCGRSAGSDGGRPIGSFWTLEKDGEGKASGGGDSRRCWRGQQHWGRRDSDTDTSKVTRDAIGIRTGRGWIADVVLVGRLVLVYVMAKMLRVRTPLVMRTIAARQAPSSLERRHY